MTTSIVDIINPMFKVIYDKNVHYLENASMKMVKNGWIPVGGIGRSGNDWVQVLMKEQDNGK